MLVPNLYFFFWLFQMHFFVAVSEQPRGMLSGAVKVLFSPMLASDFTRNDGLVITGDVSAPTGKVSVQALVAPGGDALLLAAARLGSCHDSTHAWAFYRRTVKLPQQ
jgi:hypothetical protein